MITTIPRFKTGLCATCGAKGDVVKVKKETYCLSCNKNIKAHQQIERAKERNAVRGLNTKHTPNEIQKIKGSMELNRWFLARREEMTGKCKHCQGKTEKRNSLTYKCSIAHILPKAYFKSIATHPLNWIELCFYGNSCHTNYDNYSLDLMQLNCFDEVIEKFIKMYPDIAPEERRRIPDILLQYVKDNT